MTNERYGHNLPPFETLPCHMFPDVTIHRLMCLLRMEKEGQKTRNRLIKQLEDRFCPNIVTPVDMNCIVHAISCMQWGLKYCQSFDSPHMRI